MIGTYWSDWKVGNKSQNNYSSLVRQASFLQAGWPAIFVCEKLEVSQGQKGLYFHEQSKKGDKGGPIRDLCLCYV